MASSSRDTTPPVAPFVLSNGSFRTLIAPQVTMVTTLGASGTVGKLVLELDAAEAPMSTANMLAYVHDGFYNDILFHRVISGFVVQGGGLTTGLKPRVPTYDPISLESANGLSNLRGTVGMARNPGPDTATSQFFVNLVDNTSLDYASPEKPGYAVFGKVVSGMEMIDAMAAQPVGSVGGLSNVPQSDITILLAAQTRAGKSISKTGVVSVGALEAGARWEYSTNGGASWVSGKGSSFKLAEGSYSEHSIQVRQTDAAGNTSLHAGSSEVILVVDKTAPKAVAFSPATAAKGMGVADDIVITFNEPVMLGSGVVTLKTAAGVVVQSWEVSPGSDAKTALTINPSKDLLYSVSYQLQISPGVVTDLAGNAYGGIKNYKFSTTDTVNTAAAAYTLTTEANKLAYVGTGNFSGKGNGAANVMTGGAGNDKLWGQGGNDILVGGTGQDILYGEDGSDTLTGGAGPDYFVLSHPAHSGVDLFADFTQGEDKIAFIQQNFGAFPQPLTAADLLVGPGKKAPDNGQHLIYNTKTGELWYDADGSAATAAVKLAVIGKVAHPALSVVDFVLG